MKPQHYEIKTSLIKINFSNYTNTPNQNYENLFLSLTEIIKAVLGIIELWEINVTFLNPDHQLKLNQKYRQKKYVPDVLSFPFEISQNLQNEIKTQPIGDITFCPQKILEQAENKSIDFKEELSKLFIHGTLHILGYDHQKDNDYNIMHNLEQLIFQQIT